VPEEKLRDLNGHFIIHEESNAGGGVLGPTPGFGPTVDGPGGYITDMPNVLFKKGRYHKELKGVIAGSTANEVCLLILGRS